MYFVDFTQNMSFNEQAHRGLDAYVSGCQTSWTMKRLCSLMGALLNDDDAGFTLELGNSAYSIGSKYLTDGATRSRNMFDAIFRCLDTIHKCGIQMDGHHGYDHTYAWRHVVKLRITDDGKKYVEKRILKILFYFVF